MIQFIQFSVPGWFEQTIRKIQRLLADIVRITVYEIILHFSQNRQAHLETCLYTQQRNEIILTLALSVASLCILVIISLLELTGTQLTSTLSLNAILPLAETVIVKCFHMKV